MQASSGWLEALRRWDVAARPDRDEPEWWAGAPSVVRDEAGTFWMAARMRSPESPLGFRGYAVRIYRSDDGFSFEAVLDLRREDVGVPGFERPALVRDHATGRYRLYLCSPMPEGWSILRLEDADRPDRFRPAGLRAVLVPLPWSREDVARPTGYKDPVVVWAEGRWHCFVIGILQAERLFHFESADGEVWQPIPDWSVPMMDLAGWHNYATRPASLLPLGAGYVLIYEGSHTTWPDAAYNIATGLAYTPDLRRVADLTPSAPLIQSPTPGRLPVWRYSHWMWVGDEVRVYAEVECATGSHEVRVFRLPRQSI